MERQAADGTVYQSVGEDSWSPVTRTAKDGTVYKKVGGDSWSPMQAPKPQESSGLFETALNGVAKVGKAIDSVTGAPTRAAISAAQNGNNPVSAFANQFAGDPDKAPTGYDIAKKVGLSDKHYPGMTAAQQKAFDDQNNLTNAGIPSKPLSAYKDAQSWSPAQVGGAAMDVIADPTNLIPVIGESKLGATMLKGAGETIGKGGEALKGLAEKFAVNATGATGKQAATFADNAGRELLDRGIVKFGDSQAKIAERAAGAVDAANSQIDAALKKLEAQGVTVDGNKIKQNVADKIQALKTQPSQADVAKILNGELDNLSAAIEAKGTPEFGVTAAEQEKRGYNRKAGNWMDPDKSQAGKTMYGEFRQGVEDAATAADPETAALFKEGKATHGLLAPIEEAAERRAMVTGQHPAGGFLDMASAAAGAATGGPLGAVAAPVARRIISPRLTSSLAVTADKAGDILKSIPELKNLATEQPVLYNALVTHLSTPAQNALKVADTPPLKGESKWANDGAQKLIDHAPDDKATIEKAKGAMSDPKVKALLIKASDLKANTPAMTKVMTKLKSQLASGDDN